MKRIFGLETKECQCTSIMFYSEKILQLLIMLMLKVHVKRSINILMRNGHHIGHIGSTTKGWWQIFYRWTSIIVCGTSGRLTIDQHTNTWWQLFHRWTAIRLLESWTHASYCRVESGCEFNSIQKESFIHSLISVDLWARASPQLNLWFDWNASSGCTYFFSPNNTTLDNGWQPKVFHQQMKSESEKRHVHIHQFFSPTNTTLNNGKYFISRWKVKVKSDRSTYTKFLFTN